MVLASALPVPVKFASARIGEVLDCREGCKAEAGKRGLNRVRALARKLRHLVGGHIHHIGVIAKPASHRVDARPAVQPVVARIAGQDIGQAVARGIDVTGTDEGQVLKIGSSEGVIDRRLHQVGAAGRQFGNCVARIIHHIGVIAERRQPCVSPGTAINDVGQAITCQRIRIGRAEDVLEVLD